MSSVKAAFLIQFVGGLVWPSTIGKMRLEVLYQIPRNFFVSFDVILFAFALTRWFFFILSLSVVILSFEFFNILLLQSPVSSCRQFHVDGLNVLTPIHPGTYGRLCRTKRHIHSYRRESSNVDLLLSSSWPGSSGHYAFICEWAPKKSSLF